MIHRQPYHHRPMLHTDLPWRKTLVLLNQTTSVMYTCMLFSGRLPTNMVKLGREEGNTGPLSVEDSYSTKAYRYSKFGEPYSNGLDEPKEPYLSGYGEYDRVYADLATYTDWKLGYVTPNAYKVRDEPCKRKERSSINAQNDRGEDLLKINEISKLNASEKRDGSSNINTYTKGGLSAENAFEESEEILGTDECCIREDLRKETRLIIDAYRVRGEEAYMKAERRDVGEQNNKFERLMSIGSTLLREGEQGLDGGLEVGIADRLLKEASFIFASASSMDSSNLKPIDALGDTLLARGKLKLLLMEELREIITESGSDAKESVNRRGVNHNKRNQRGGIRNDKKQIVNVNDVYQRGINGSIRSTMPKICDECEGLLVEAGRKYRAVLLMNKGDEHAMYSWGLALFFRGRLLGAHDQEDAVDDAKKVYEASIPKFKAVVELNKSYVPCALFYWGLALRDQAWLYRTRNDEKMHLLEQARKVFKDAIKAYPSYAQAKLAAAACTEDLKLLHYSTL